MTARRKFSITFGVPVPPEAAQLYTALRAALADQDRGPGRAWRNTQVAPFTTQAVVAPLRMTFDGDYPMDDPIGVYIEHTLMDLARVSPGR